MKKIYAKPELKKSAIISHVTAGDGSLKQMTSDIRLKTDIERVGVAANGLPLYNFKYLWSDSIYQGVMAQDVVEVFPEAVCTTPSGHMAVRYDMLGIKMTRVG